MVEPTDFKHLFLIFEFPGRVYEEEVYKKDNIGWILVDTGRSTAESGRFEVKKNRCYGYGQ